MTDADIHRSRIITASNFTRSLLCQLHAQNHLGAAIGWILSGLRSILLCSGQTNIYMKFFQRCFGKLSNLLQ